MTTKIHLGVLFGGRSGEHEVSCSSAHSVISVLDPGKYEVIQIGISHQGEWYSGPDILRNFEQSTLQNLDRVTLIPEPGKNILYKRVSRGEFEELIPITNLDVIFPVLHGSYGEDGTLQGLLEMIDIAYVGAGVAGSSVAMDKGIFKEIMRANNIPVVDWLICTRQQLEKDMNEIISRAEKISGYPLFTKPANLGSSVGISKCKNRSDLIEGMMEAARYDRRILIERGVNAREIEVSVLGNENAQASIPGEIIPSDEFYSYRAKYLDGKSKLLIPAPLSQEQVEKVQKLALRAYHVTDCAGMARVDFLLDKDSGDLFINEANTIPGFTNISMYPKLWEASGIQYPQLVDKLIELALERKNERDRSERIYRQ
jgi:D-alanine-D-alanine ligase